MGSELNEELLHLPQIGGIAMRVEERESRKWMLPEVGDDLVPTLGVEQMDLHVLVRRHPGEHQLPLLPIPSSFPVHLVRRWFRREEREFRRHA